MRSARCALNDFASSFADESDYRSATRGYSSRFGSRALYQRYFREGFESGYRDSYNGY